MNRRQILSTLGAATTGLVAANLNRTFADDQDGDEAERGILICSFSECAEACNDCAKWCNSSFDHCTMLLQNGQRGYWLTLRTCIDCADVCTTCASLCSRESRLSKVLTEACARFCDRAATECEKHEDPHLTSCAEKCRTCAASCRGLRDVMLIAQ